MKKKVVAPSFSASDYIHGEPAESEKREVRFISDIKLSQGNKLSITIKKMVFSDEGRLFRVQAASTSTIKIKPASD